MTKRDIKTVGILGGGQLGRMLAQAALPLGIRCVFLEDAPDCPASAMGNVYPTTQFADFAAAADVFTLEFENTPVDTARELASRGLSPCADALAVAQDRLEEKQTFVNLGIDTVPFQAVNTQADLADAAERIGLPLVVKTTRGGYDGKGQYVVKTTADIAAAWDELGQAAPLIAEGFIHFTREVSIIAVRGRDGDIKTYPLVENHHHDGILAKSIAPAPDAAAITQQATQAITQLLTHFDYVGVLTLELFVTDTGLIANEIAPRVHNSGHWSIEGAVTSQFENHIRAVTGLPLGSTDIVHPSMMVNIIGEHPDSAEVLAVSGAHLHDYAKSARPDRKIGHITLMPPAHDQLDSALSQLVACLPNKLGMS